MCCRPWWQDGRLRCLCCWGWLGCCWYMMAGIWSLAELAAGDDALLLSCPSLAADGSAGVPIVDCLARGTPAGPLLLVAAALSLMHPALSLGCGLAVGLISIAKLAACATAAVYTIGFLADCGTALGSCEEFDTAPGLLLATAIALSADAVVMCSLAFAAARGGCKTGRPFISEYRP